jgi:zeaxanthin glucosyltransferase
MGSVLLVTSEMAGRINMMCELARRLEAAGHSAAVACPVDVRDRVEAHGVTYFDIPASTPPSVATAAVASRRTLGRATAFVARLGQMRHTARRRIAKAQSLNAAGIRSAIAGADPDAVLVDVELPVHIMAVAATHLPMALWTSMLSLWKQPGLPPLGSDIQPGHGWRGSKAGIEMAWLRFRIWKWVRRQRFRATRFGEDQMSVLREVAEQTGFPLEHETDVGQWLVPFTYRTVPIVSFNALELEFPHEPLPTCTYLGPLLPADGRRADRGDADTAARLDALFRRRRDGQSDALIYCAFGAWHKGDDRDFLSRILEAVSARPRWDVIVGLGGRIEPSSLGSVPPNVHLFGWAPQLEILRHADCAVHHGGISTVNECITNGAPMVIYPFDFMDQPGNAARVAYHGIGEVGDRGHDAAADIAGRIDRMLTDPAVHARLDTMRAAFGAYQAERRAVAYIESLLPDRKAQ